MIDEYLDSKLEIIDKPLTKKQIKQLEKLNKDFKKQLKLLIKAKPKRQVGAGQKKQLSERGGSVSHIMKIYGLSLPQASKAVKKLHDKGLSYKDISQMKE